VIRKTLAQTKAATFAIDLPNDAAGGMPIPTGTGFFVSEDGWFITAGHVIETEKGDLRDDLEEAFLTKEPDPDGIPAVHKGLRCEFIDKQADIALVKVDLQENGPVVHRLSISAKPLEEGEPVYSFGYPLSSGGIVQESDGIKIGMSSLSPRTTSAIVASTLEGTGPVMEIGGPPRNYVLDKALNYGNSGGPIVAADTGKVHAVCTRFQPVTVPQPHIPGPGGGPFRIQIPSLYGVVSNIGQPPLLEGLVERDIIVEGL
jgi:S1-C subfamily serine protease